jgi:hypothetical protein
VRRNECYGGLLKMAEAPPLPTEHGLVPVLPLSERQRNAAGVVCLTLIIVSWVAQAELMHRLHLEEEAYAPALMIFIIHAVWVAGLPLALLVRWFVFRPNLPPLPWRTAAIYGAIVSQIGFFG